MDNKSASQRLQEGVTKTQSQGICTRVVINAIKGNKDLYGSACGIASPIEAKDYLESIGYKVYTGAPKTGVVRIYHPIRGHKFGHIQMYCGDGKWRSDFVQNQANPFADRQATDLYTDYSRD